MRLAIYNPQFGVSGRPKSLHPYAKRFLEIYRPLIYISDWGQWPLVLKWLGREKINPFSLRFVWSMKSLNQHVDVLISFNGRPDLKKNCPPKDFEGTKIVHLMDYIYQASQSNDRLTSNKIDWVLCYNAADKYDSFFREYYPSLVGKVVPMPFGYNRRFTNLVPLNKRTNKCVALGAVRKINDERINEESFADFVDYFYHKQNQQWLHKFRRMLVENEVRLADIMDSKLPHHPETANFGYDINETYNRYRMFTTCEGITFFPSVKTFEGMATGSVLVCSDHPCFTDYGLKDGINCIKHKQYDIEDFEKRVKYYIANPDKLNEIANNGMDFVKKYYNDVVMAKYLYTQIERITSGKKPLQSPLEF